MQGQLSLLVGNQAYTFGNVAVKQCLKKHVLYLKLLALEGLRRFLKVQHAGNGWVLKELAQYFINFNAQQIMRDEKRCNHCLQQLCRAESPCPFHITQLHGVFYDFERFHPLLHGHLLTSFAFLEDCNCPSELTAQFICSYFLLRSDLFPGNLCRLDEVLRAEVLSFDYFHFAMEILLFLEGLPSFFCFLLLLLFESCLDNYIFSTHL